MTLAVIDPAVKSAELSSFNFLSLMAEAPLSYHLPVLQGFDSLKALAEMPVKGIVILGSYASPNENSPWQRELERHIEQWIARQVPIFGICYGHQLIAKMLGGKVKFCPESHSGFRNVEIEKDKRLKIKAMNCRLFAAHREEVSEKPDAMEIWMKSERIAFDGLRMKDLPVWTLQTHPEANASFCKSRGLSSVDPGDLKNGCKILRSFFKFCKVS